MRVLLFDIDGTLIRSGGAGKAAMEEGLKSAFGIREIFDTVSYSGRTDPGISRELLELHGIEPNEMNLERLKSAYLSHLPAKLRENGGNILPGVADILQLDRRGTAVGLLTGNIRAGAEIKLRHFDLWHHFAFGGFADGYPSRNDVARHALNVAETHLAMKVEPSRVWVIGDTPLDVECARSIGARAVLVGTGWHTHDELVDSKPDYLLPDLTHFGPLLAEWGW